MQKKIIAVAVAGLSTAAFAQTNVTIYGVADVSGQGYSMSAGKALPAADGQTAQGSVFSLQSNSSLIGFKGTEDLGNGLKALFQAETNLNLTGGNGASSAITVSGTSNSAFGSLRDTFIGMTSKYGSGMAGYISTPFRSSLTSFDVMPGATGAGTIEKIMGTMRFSNQAMGTAATATAGAYEFGSSLRGTAIAYAMPTLYGFDASIAYTGSNNNGLDNRNTTVDGTSTTQSSQTPNSLMSFNLGWTGYGVNIKGAFSQAKYNLTDAATAANDVDATNAYTSYLVGAMYTGVPGLKVSAVYNRNSMGLNANAADFNGAGKLSNNQFWTGASYRMGNWEPRISAVWTSDISGSTSNAVSQAGARQWTANVGYYMSKRTQVYGIISNLNNSANQNYNMGLQANRLQPTGGQNTFTYGAGLRTTF